MKKERLYLAGPDVFRPGAQARQVDASRELEVHGFVAVSPISVPVPAEISGPALARYFYLENLKLIETCDAIVAEITPWRGPHMDPGTAFEVGYGVARGLPIALFGAAGDLRSRVPSKLMPSGECIDAAGNLVEDFGLAENLMVGAAALAVTDTMEQALAFLRAHFNAAKCGRSA